MNKNERPSFLRGRGAAVGLVICFVAVIAIAGAYTFNNYKKQMNEQVAKAEDQAEELTEDKSKEAATDDIVLPEEDDKEEDGAQEEQTETPQETPAQDGAAGGEASASGAAADVWFSEDSTLTWPASGAVLIGYSMDQTVFFSTLEQYKYNPALIIGGEVGETISASAAGISPFISMCSTSPSTASSRSGRVRRQPSPG